MMCLVNSSGSRYLMRNRKENGTDRRYQKTLPLAELKDSMEVLITAAQQEPLRTRSIKAGIYQTRQDCRLCKDAPETIQHITAE